MHKIIFIIIKDYNTDLSKRQPWYSVKKLVSDLENLNYEVNVISEISDIPTNFSGCVVKIFGLKDLFFYKKRRYKLVYFMTFPIYGIDKFLLIPKKIIIENWSDLKRIFILSLLPKFILKNTLSKADEVIVISDRSEKIIFNIVKTKKYIPFIFNNWGGIKKKTTIQIEQKTIGYFGPPFTTRSFDDIILFFSWLNRNNYNLNKTIITRIERDDLKKKAEKYLNKLKDDTKLKIVSGFLDRQSLANELSEIDVLILPFKIVMSELPIVVLEALELGISIVTTKDSGIETITKNQKNVLMLNNFSKDNYKEIIEFINNHEEDNFETIKKTIIRTNTKTLEAICKK